MAKVVWRSNKHRLRIKEVTACSPAVIPEAYTP